MKKALGRGILYKKHGHTRIESFSNANWARSKEERYVFSGGNLISWKSKNQTVVSRSSAKLEYRVMAQFVCKIMWIKVGIETSIPVKLLCDQAAMNIASNPVFHERTKHIEIDCHFVLEKIQLGLISTGYVKTGE